MNRATSRIVGPNENRIVCSSERLLGDFALMTTSFVVSSDESSSLLANVGISVSKPVALSPLYLTSFLNSPWTVSPLEEISFTLLLRDLREESRVVGDPDALLGGAKTATNSQLSTNSPSRIAMKRRPLHGIIGGFWGARSARTSPGLGPRGGRGGGGAGGRASSAIRQS